MEYNKLTKRLLAEGYTADNYPKDKVHIANCARSRENPLDNPYGGFEYNRVYYEAFVYTTGCGKYVYGKNTISSMATMGVEWCHENDNPVIRCPYDKAECPDNDSRLHGMHGGGLCIQCWCVCHRTDESYEYDNSIEKANQERKDEKELKKQNYIDSKNGRACENHMFYDERNREWNLRYEPKRCATMCYARNGGGYCPILGKQLSKERGNVYYDLKIAQRRYDLDGTLFEGQIDTEITKGIRVFESPVSMDICNAYVKTSIDELERHVKLNRYHQELFFAEYFGRHFTVEIMNVRAEKKESRDLLQDLQDIKDGIRISHASDSEKNARELKRENRQKAKEKRISAIEKKVLQVGYYNMDTFEQNRVCKLLDFDRIDELEELRERNLTEVKPEQISMFDFIDGKEQ